MTLPRRPTLGLASGLAATQTAPRAQAAPLTLAERTKHGIAGARATGKRHGRQPLDADKTAAALKLVAAGLSPTAAARQLGLGRSTVYREVSRTGLERHTGHPSMQDRQPSQRTACSVA